ncbi:glucose 1-dehydrogenase [Leifsonia bigeumensis]|uniref:Glucose 1-dehydrogenase n=1 Tax=Leifsonella bigeumensis TaxID=433643 RepID=A0ABP7FDN0_9MICO
MGKLDGKVALITGGAMGMGAADAALLASEGATVVVTDVDEKDGNAVAASIGGHYRHLDVTSEDNWREVVADVVATIGNIDILVNNAGVVAFTPVATTELAEWNRVIDINLTGVFLGIRSVVETMKAAGGGVIVNLSSTAGMMGYSNLSAYVASKWGVRGLTKAAALDLGRDNIRVVSVHPGGIRTPMTAGLEGNEMYASQPIPRIGEPDEVARLILYLVADATFSTGTEFIVDGGATVGQALNV